MADLPEDLLIALSHLLYILGMAVGLPVTGPLFMKALQDKREVSKGGCLKRENSTRETQFM